MSATAINRKPARVADGIEVGLPNIIFFNCLNKKLEKRLTLDIVFCIIIFCIIISTILSKNELFGKYYSWGCILPFGVEYPPLIPIPFFCIFFRHSPFTPHFSSS